MKLSFNTCRTRGTRAFTLMEVMVSSAIFGLLLTSVILCHLFALSMATRQQIWMDASSDSCKAVSTLMTDIRTAQVLAVGNMVGGAFTKNPDHTNQLGSALMVYTASNAAPPWILYYYDTTSNMLVRTNYKGPGIAGDYKIVSANPITNDLPIFTMEDSTGTVFTNIQVLSVVDVYLSFTRFQNPQVIIALGNIVDLYQIRLKITPRAML